MGALSCRSGRDDRVAGLLDRPLGQGSRGGAAADRAVRDVELAAVARAVDRAVRRPRRPCSPGGCTSAENALNVPGRRLGDDDLLVARTPCRRRPGCRATFATRRCAAVAADGRRRLGGPAPAPYGGAASAPRAARAAPRRRRSPATTARRCRRQYRPDLLQCSAQNVHAERGEEPQRRGQPEPDQRGEHEAAEHRQHPPRASSFGRMSILAVNAP